jgi:hypothetical protein
VNMTSTNETIMGDGSSSIIPDPHNFMRGYLARDTDFKLSNGPNNDAKSSIIKF